MGTITDILIRVHTMGIISWLCRWNMYKADWKPRIVARWEKVEKEAKKINKSSTKKVKIIVICKEKQKWKKKRRQKPIDDVQRFLEVFCSHMVDVARVVAASPYTGRVKLAGKRPFSLVLSLMPVSQPSSCRNRNSSSLCMLYHSEDIH